MQKLIFINYAPLSALLVFRRKSPSEIVAFLTLFVLLNTRLDRKILLKATQAIVFEMRYLFVFCEVYFSSKQTRHIQENNGKNSKKLNKTNSIII